MDTVKLDVRKLVALLLVMASFFFILATLDYLLMSNFDFWKNPDLLYRYWIILSLVVVVFAFGLSFMGYLTGLGTWICAALFSTVLLLFAGGLLDEFYFCLTFLQSQSYSFANWSFQSRVIMSSWGWFEQIVWSALFYGVIAIIWIRILRKN